MKETPRWRLLLFPFMTHCLSKGNGGRDSHRQGAGANDENEVGDGEEGIGDTLLGWRWCGHRRRRGDFLYPTIVDTTLAFWSLDGYLNLSLWLLEEGGRSVLLLHRLRERFRRYLFFC